MTAEQKEAIETLRAEVGRRRLSPRALVQVDDGAVLWLTTRSRFRKAPMWAKVCVAKSDREGRRPDRYSYPETRDEDAAGRHNPRGYTAACGRIANLTSLGDFPSDELPEDFMRRVPFAGDLY